MFSKIKSLCKEFYKSRKSVASFVLAMMLAFSAFMSIGIKSDAAYTTSKFYFDLSSVAKDALASFTSDEDAYLYIFRATSSNPMTRKSVSYNGGTYSLDSFRYKIQNSWSDFNS